MNIFQISRLESCLGCTLGKACRFLALFMIALNLLLCGGYLLVSRLFYPEVDHTPRTIRVLIFTALYVPSNVYLYLAAYYRKLAYFRVWFICMIVILMAYALDTSRAYIYALQAGSKNLPSIPVHFIFMLILGYILFIVYSHYLELQELDKQVSNSISPAFTLKLAHLPYYEETGVTADMKTLLNESTEKSAVFLDKAPDYDEAVFGTPAEPPPPYTEH